MTLVFPKRALMAAALTLATSAALVGCANAQDTAEANKANTEQKTDTDQKNDAAKTETESGAFPVTFKNADGTTTEIKTQPKKVLSTTVTTTGTLLAIDAPVVASSADARGEWFGQWAKFADERNVKKLWPAGKVNIEQAYAEKPDLIIVSQTGADNGMQQLEQFRKIAPTIVVNYSKLSWQQLAQELAPALGLQANAEALIKKFDDEVAATKAKIQVPAGETAIVSYNGPGKDNPISMQTGPHAQLLAQLGFKIEEPNPAWQNNPQKRNDYVFADYEHLSELTANTVMILNRDDQGAQKFAQDPILKNVPAVKENHVYGLGKNTFRLDYYSALTILESVTKNFAK